MSSNMISKIKDVFKSPEQKEIEARMEFNKNRRAFQKYYNDLDGSIKNFSKMAREAELSGNHENAISCATFVIKLQKTQVKVQGLLQRFEMMYNMQRLSHVMTRFVDACADMGVDMNNTIDLKGVWKSTAKIDTALGKMDQMTDLMGEVFNTVDGGLGNSVGEYQTPDEITANAEEMLNKIMGRGNIVESPVPQAAAEAAPPETKAVEQEQDDIDERLRKMKQELEE